MRESMTHEQRVERRLEQVVDLLGEIRDRLPVQP